MTEYIDSGLARRWWRALIENVVSLIEDAHLLLEHGSAGRARSLAVLAKEELGKATWIYELAAVRWTCGEPQVILYGDFPKRFRHHTQKLIASLQFDADLEPFWGDYSSRTYEQDHEWGIFDEPAERLNKAKQAGFYVDRIGDVVNAPADISAHGIASDIVRLAQVALMMLISDHTRTQDLAGDPDDPTHDLQTRLLPIGYAEEWKASRQAESPE